MCTQTALEELLFSDLDLALDQKLKPRYQSAQYDMIAKYELEDITTSDDYENDFAFAPNDYKGNCAMLTVSEPRKDMRWDGRSPIPETREAAFAMMKGIIEVIIFPLLEHPHTFCVADK